jgi:hypothetical protein
MVMLTAIPTEMQMYLNFINILLAFSIFVTYFVIMTSRTGNNDISMSNIRNYGLLLIIPTIVCIIAISFCDSMIKRQGYKILQDTPATKLTQTSVEQNSDRTWYIYRYNNSKGINYVILSDTKINLSGYTVKIPHDKWYGEYIYLYKHGKFVKDYEITETCYVK